MNPGQRTICRRSSFSFPPASQNVGGRAGEHKAGPRAGAGAVADHFSLLPLPLLLLLLSRAAVRWRHCAAIDVGAACDIGAGREILPEDGVDPVIRQSYHLLYHRHTRQLGE